MKPFVFILGTSQISFIITPKNLKKIPESKNDIISKLMNYQQYEVRSNVRKETFESFLLYWADGTEPDINIDNILEYYQLSDEFGIINNYISSPEFESIFNISYLNSFNENVNLDKTLIERTISQKLDYYLDEYTDYLFRIPVVSLYNIFNFSERKLINQEKAYYSIINAAENQNKELYILLKTIDGEKLSYQSLKDSFNNKENHLEFSPKNSEKYVTIIENKLKLYEEKNNQLNDLKCTKINLTYTNQIKETFNNYRKIMFPISLIIINLMLFVALFDIYGNIIEAFLMYLISILLFVIIHCICIIFYGCNKTNSLMTRLIFFFGGFLTILICILIYFCIGINNLWTVIDEKK